MIKAIRLLLFMALCLCSIAATAQMFQPSPEQIQKFKSLSPQQQRQIAESMGIDIDALIGQQVQGLSPTAETVGGQAARGRQQLGAMQPTRKYGVTPEEIAQIREDYRDLEHKVFNKLFERKYAQAISRENFLKLYQYITGQKFEERKELKPFGYDLFTLPADAFTPPMGVPVPLNYIMGPGDTLVIQLYGKENNTYRLTISRDGQIQFPGIGPINLAGLTFSQAQDVIADTVNEQMLGINHSITMGSLRTIRVFVLGDVVQPGSYTVSSLSTMTNALFASGGITEIGSLRNIKLKRDGEVVTTLDVYDLLLEGDTSHDARLLPGDVIFVPPVGDIVTVKGEVKRPAIYELKHESTAAEVIALAGGMTPRAYGELTRLRRINNNGEISLIPLDLSTSRGKSFTMRNADSLTVGRVLDELDSAITLKGHVKRPGIYAWRESFHFSDLVTSIDSLKSNPDLHAALIKRVVPSTKQIEIYVFSPSAAWANPGSAADPLLHKKDTLFLFDYETNRTQTLEKVLKELEIQSHYQERGKIVSIVGSVRFPGKYPLAEGMTADELIRLAGGLTESALGTVGEITRYSISDNLERLVVHMPVNLQSAATRIQPADTLRIKQIPRWQEKETVTISGEVTFPGNYTIIPGETLTDLLERAGGLTREAYPEGAIFSRADLRALERERLEDLRNKLKVDIAASNLQEGMVSDSIDKEEAARLMASLESVDAVGRMVIDLPHILKAPATYDFKLEDGDTLVIPRYKPSVTVVGEVQYSTSHFFDRKLDVYEYIARSGGTKPNADEERIYIVKANGQVIQPEESAWFRSTSQIEPGDTIVVPIDTDQVDQLTVWSSVTQIMYQAALGIAAISSL